jgi:hypothetical protein
VIHSFPNAGDARASPTCLRQSIIAGLPADLACKVVSPNGRTRDRIDIGAPVMHPARRWFPRCKAGIALQLGRV